MSQALFVKPNPFSEALAGMHCGIFPALLLGSFAHISSEREFLLYLFLGAAAFLAVMHRTGDLTLQFALPCIGTYVVGLGLLTKSFTDDFGKALMMMILFMLLYVALYICEMVWRKRNPQ